MELELGLKFTRVADEFTSDFQITKDRAGALFLSRETDTVFVLTAHLKGYKRGNIKIDINEDGSLIGINGEKQVRETTMVGWRVYKKDAEVKGFKKVFRIPDGVILDKIKATFNEDESTLTITMPKKVKGIRGTSIEEVKEEHQLVKQGSENLQIADEQNSDNGEKLNEVDDLKDGEGGLISPSTRSETCKEDAENQGKVEGIEERIGTKEDQEVDKESDAVENQRKVEENEERIENKEDQEVDKESDVLENEEVENQKKVEENEERIENKEDQEIDKENDVIEKEERSGEEKERPFVVETAVGRRGDDESGNVEEKRCKMCLPIVAGSTLLLSFVVFVIQIIRSKNRNSTRRD